MEVFITNYGLCPVASFSIKHFGYATRMLVISCFGHACYMHYPYQIVHLITDGENNYEVPYTVFCNIHLSFHL